MDEEKGITLGEIFRTIFTKKWLALIIAVAITVIGSLVLILGYNPSKTEYVSTFSVNLVKQETETSPGNKTIQYIYPNGQIFNFRELTARSNIESIRKSSEEFADIDVEKMYKTGGISIAQNVDSASGDVTYTLRIQTKFFPSSPVASNFINCIVNTPGNAIKSWVNSQSSQAQTSFDAKSGNEAKMQYINSLIEAIGQRFSKLNGISNVAMEKVKDLTDVAATLTGLLHTEFYEPSRDVLQSYIYAISGLNNKLEVAQNKLDDLKGAIADGSSSGVIWNIESSEIIKCSEEVTRLKQQIAAYEGYLTKAGATKEQNYSDLPATIVETTAMKSFSNRLNDLLAGVKLLTDVYESEYYNNTSIVSYDGTQITAEGGMGTVLSLAISLVAGLLIAAIVAFIVGNRAIKSQAAEELQSDENPESTEKVVQGVLENSDAKN